MRGGDMPSKKAVGRPPKYTSKEQIEELIELYFKSCEGEILRNQDGEPILNKYGMPIRINARPPTITGLAYALGFSTRKSLLDYQGKIEFVNTITRAKMRVEQYTEERLFDRDGVNGAKFSLANNFQGWTEHPQSDLDRQEQEARIATLRAKNQNETQEEIANDGFLDALNATAAEDWSDEEAD